MDPIPLAEAAAKGLDVTFRCRTCGQLASRPAAWLLNRYGATTLAEVQARARCLAYRAGVRCGGRAEVNYAVPPAKPPAGQPYAFPTPTA